MGDSLKQKMITTVAWSSIDRFGQQIVQFISGIIFARLLFPEDFGIMGIVMIFVAISMILVESGFGQALIRKTDISDDDYTSVFFFNLGTALVLYLVLFFTAPLISSFFHQQQLTLLIRVLSLVVLINSLYLIPTVTLSRVLNFKTISLVNISAITGGALCGVAAAFAGLGVWALVVQQTIFHLLRLLLMQLQVKWKPTGKFRFSIIREIWKFSLKILFTSLVNVLFNNLFIIILGRSYTKAETGQFSQGNKLSETFSFTFQSIFAGSTYALFSQLQNDIPRFGRILGEIIRRAALITIPVIGVLITVASPLITIIWTDKFLPAVSYFQLMSLASILTPFYVMNINALNVRGKSGKTMAVELIKKVLIVAGIILLYQFGIRYMLLAYVVGSLLAYPVSVWFVKKELNQPILKQLSHLLPGILTAICVTALTAVAAELFTLSPVLTLIVQLTVAAISYWLIIRIFFPDLYFKFRDYLATRLSNIKKDRL